MLHNNWCVAVKYKTEHLKELLVMTIQDFIDSAEDQWLVKSWYTGNYGARQLNSVNYNCCTVSNLCFWI